MRFRQRAISIACAAIILLACVIATVSFFSGGKKSAEEVGDWEEMTPAEKQKCDEAFSQCKRLIVDRRVFAFHPWARLDLPEMIVTGLPTRGEDFVVSGKKVDRRETYLFEGPDPRNVGNADSLVKDCKIQIRVSHYLVSGTWDLDFVKEAESRHLSAFLYINADLWTGISGSAQRSIRDEELLLPAW